MVSVPHKRERRISMKREVLLLGDPALYEVSTGVTSEEMEEMRKDIEDMLE